MTGTAPRQHGVEVAVIGDGPSGSALAAVCAGLGVDVVLIGNDDPWTATYGSWLDDLAASGAIAVDGDRSVVATSVASIGVHGVSSRQVDRRYGVLDNTALRTALRTEVEHRLGYVERVDAAPSSGRVRVALVDGTQLDARVVVDASGWPSSFTPRGRGAPPAWQTAMGVVLEEPPDGDLGQPTLMDFRAVRAAPRPGESGSTRRRSTIGPAGVPTFCYAVPVDDGWLVEETVLAARPAIEPVALLGRLAARLGRHPDTLLGDAVRTEYVRIPMGGARPLAGDGVVTFGAAAGYTHPATGFSVAASLGAAPRVADAIAAALEGGARGRMIDVAGIERAVWPTSWRRSRVLHDYGLEVLLDLDPDQTREFFDAFFALPVQRWSAYLRLDSAPRDVTQAMWEVFRTSSWSMRGRLASAAPSFVLRRLR